jgi:hypothetical protein
MDRPIPANAVDVFLIKSLRDDVMVGGFSKIYRKAKVRKKPVASYLPVSYLASVKA